MSKKALIITYYWPPSGGSGVQRWVYFSKYLSRLGITPVVLTVDPAYATYPSIDESLLKDVEGVRVIHTKSFEPLQLYSKFVSGNKKDGVPFGDVKTAGKSPVKKLAAFVRGNLVLPDARKYWKRYALAAAKELLKEEPFDVVISTGPPHSTHLIAKALKEQSDFPWIADFRDPWTEVFYNEDLFRTKWAKKIDLNLEKSVVNAADAVLCVSDFTAELVKHKISNKNKVHTIINGYDHEVFDQVKAKKNQSFTIAYIGYMGKHHPYQVFIKGIEKALQTIDFEDEVVLDLAGKIDDEILTAFRDIPNLKVNYDGIVTHLEAIKKMKSADMLLLSIPTSSYAKGIITGKLLEYIATGNPIVLVGEKQGDAAKILGDFKNTLAINETEIEAFVQFFKEIAHHRPVENISEITKKYTREITAVQLVGIINDLTRLY